MFWLVVRKFQVRLGFGELAVALADLVAVELVPSSLHKVFDLLDCCLNALKSDPFECWFARIRHLSFDNQSNRLQDVCNVVQPSDLRLEHLIVHNFVWRNLPSSLLKRNDSFPGDKQSDELLAEVAK